MEKIKLITDSTCDLTDELLQKFAIEVVPLYINFPDESFFDGVNITAAEMYQKVADEGILPKTAAASPGAFLNEFKKYLSKGYKIIYIGVGSKFSASLSSANTAKLMLETNDIILIDSQNLSAGSGMLLIKAGEMIEAGLSAEQIKVEIEKIIPKLRTQFVVDTLEYLYKGGRLNALSAMMGMMLKIKPIIKVRDGVMVVGKKIHGKINKAIDLMVEEMLEHKEEIDPDLIIITHSYAKESAEYIKKRITDAMKINRIYETDAGCVISSHCGKGTVGVLYILK